VGSNRFETLEKAARAFFSEHLQDSAVKLLEASEYASYLGVLQSAYKMKATFRCTCLQQCADSLVVQLQTVNQPDDSVEIQNAVAEMAAAAIEKAHVWHSIMPLCLVRTFELRTCFFCVAP
jgi:hypothetical protein